MDWVFLVLPLAFAVLGLLRGMISQVFAVLGLVAGLWAAGWVSQWVGVHWRGAQPAAAFFFLRWLIVIAAGLTVAALGHWWGERLRGAVRETPAGWLDRLAGSLLGGVLGSAIATIVWLALVLLPWPRPVARAAASARLARPVMAAGAAVCSWGSGCVPGGDWLRQRFLAAERRARRDAGPS